MTRQRSVAVAALIGLAIIPLLVVLSGGVGNLTVRTGLAFPPDDRPAAPPPDLSAQMPPTLFNLFTFVSTMAAVMLIYGLVLSIRSRRFRLQFGISLLAFAATILAYSLAFLLPPPATVPIPAETRASTATEAEEETPVVEAAPQYDESGVRSAWQVLVAGSVATLFLVASVVLAFRFRFHPGRRSSSQQAAAAEVVESIEDAAIQIRAGGNISGIVQQCYARMSATLSTKAKIDATCMTPREFAASLESLGLSGRHVERLTRVFELVRYGQETDTHYAQEALSCIDAIRAAYSEATA